MDIPADRPAGSPLARAHGASPDPTKHADTLRDLAQLYRARDLGERVAKSHGALQLVFDANGRVVGAAPRAKIKLRHALTVGEAAAVRKAQKAGVLPVFDANGKLRGVLDPEDLEDEGSIDEAVYDQAGKQIGFADEDDVVPVASLPSEAPRQPKTQPQVTPAFGGTEPTPENVRKALKQLDDAMKANPWAAEVLRRRSARR